ncbi:MAG: sugar phosphate isomerase/epimerase family protein [Planctomycetota bacterium]
MMRVGLDTFTIRELGLDPFGQLDWIAEHGFEGAQFGRLDADLGRMREIRRHADEKGLYSYVSVPSVNPHRSKGTASERRDQVRVAVERAAECGWHELVTSLGGPDDRYESAVPWTTQLADSAETLRSLAPVLRDHGSRINVETHGDITTFELVRLIESVGPDVVGVCLDTANVLCFGEDPAAAAGRVAPYTHTTHAKDAIVFFDDKGVCRQGRPPGQGVVDWERVLAVLAEHEPDLPLSIEDHKWLFSAEIFDPAWHEAQPDLSRAELGEFVRLAWDCQRRIHSGELPDPEEYEAVPYAEQMEERLAFGRDYLQGLLDRLGLRA